VTALGYKDICRLNISVDDAFSMGSFKRIRYFYPEFQNLFRG